MKKILFFTVAVLLLVTGMQKVYACGQTFAHIPVNAPFGTISCVCGCYLHDQNKIWYINTGHNQKVHLKYNIEIHPSSTVHVFNGHWEDGDLTFGSLITTFYGGLHRGTLETDSVNGGCVIVFDPGVGSCSATYPGIEIEFIGGQIINANLAVMGNMGIGITNPTEKLEVNGTVRAKKVIVEPEGWADFVFADGYELPSLSEIESHIEAQGHLPGIPSAAEATANGVNLAEINTKLLQKVEELMLYVIAQNKRLEMQREEIASLKKRIGGIGQQAEE